MAEEEDRNLRRHSWVVKDGMVENQFISLDWEQLAIKINRLGSQYLL